MGKIYKKFKAKETRLSPVASRWSVVTDDKDEITVAVVPDYIKNPKTVAHALSSSLTDWKYALTDLL